MAAQLSPRQQQEIRDQKRLDDRMNNYFNPSGSQTMTLTGNRQEQEAAASGLEFARLGYGENIADIGKNISEIRQKYKERIAGADPVSAAIRNQKADAVAAAQSQMQSQGVTGGAAVLAAQGIGKAQDARIAESLYGQQRTNLGDLRSLESNALAGTTALMQGSKAEGTASSQPLPPQSKGLMDSVICTELHRQGLLETEVYLKDAEFGVFLKQNHPNVVVGYHFLAKPVVKLMKKSPLFTKIISYPTLKWAYYIAGKSDSVIGTFIFKVGIPVCSVIGTIKTKIVGEKYVQL
jgi:hypothetical protein